MYTPRELLAQSSRFGPQADNAVGGVDLAQQQGTVAELAVICRAWGAAVASLHTMSTRHSAAALAPRPLVLKTWHLMPSVRDAAPGSGYAAVLEAYESSPDLRAAASEVDERWTERHWIHGNLGAFNVLVEQWPALQVSFLYLENAGLGDPAWDLASAVDTITWLSPRWRAMPQLLVDYFLQGYRRAGGPGWLYPAMQAVSALASALWFARSEDESDRPEQARAEVTIQLDRAHAYADRVRCLRAVA